MVKSLNTEVLTILNNIKVSAIITSGGNSTRFGSNKLLEKLGEYSVIETTILKFLPLVDEVVVPCKDDIREHLKGSMTYCDKIKFAPAGETRQKSVHNGILACSKPDIVLIHDGARPYIDADTIKKAISLTYEKKATLVGKMAIDTIKVVEEGKIVKTLDRKKIFHAQTPQSFDYELIKKLHEKYQNEADFTDDASMAERFGVDVYIIENNNKNDKITLKQDLAN